MKRVSQEDLNEAVRKHGLWLAGKAGGERLALRGSNLRGSNLRGSNLSGSDLRGSNLRDSNLSDSDLSNSDLSNSDLRDSNLSDSDLRYSNLRGSNLSDSDLRYSDLRDSNLSNSDLSGVTGFVLLPVQDMRGYSFPHAIQTDNGWRIRAGCRDFSIEDAREHWGVEYEGDRSQGDMYLHATDWLEKWVGERE